MILRNNITRMESNVEYHVATHAQDYADLVQAIQTENDLDEFLDDFPRVDSIAFDENNPSAYLEYLVNIETNDINLPNSNVTTKLVQINMNNQFLEKRDLSSGNPARTIQLQLIKSFN